MAMICTAAFGQTPPLPASEPAPLERYSLMGAIKDGYLNGNVDVGTLRKQGDFGLGGFESFDGEMLLLNGVVYRVPFDGVPEVAKDADRLTYAEFTRFRPSRTLQETAIGKTALLKKLRTLLGNPNQFYSVKITGTFSTIRYRTMVAQSPPYHKPICAKLIDHVFDKQSVQGTIIGFINPGFVKGGIDYPGSHLHFLSASRQLGGHVYDFEIESATVEIGSHQVFVIHLPTAPSFADVDTDDEYPCPSQN